MTDFTKPLDQTESFLWRHLGPRDPEISEMLRFLGLSTLDDLVEKTVPKKIRVRRPLQIATGKSEEEALHLLREMADKNKVHRNFMGMGYYGTNTPAVISRNILENPGWYTQYTPYQAEIAQGRLEALLNFQTMVMDLTGMEVANASLLDEATAAAEAMGMCVSLKASATHDADTSTKTKMKFFVDENCFPQTIDVLRTRASGFQVEIVTGKWDEDSFTNAFDKSSFLGVLVQYPMGNGGLADYRELAKKTHDAEGIFVVATDLLALTLLNPPSEFDADIVVGTTQRFGIPLGFGGPHAAFFSTREKFKRQMPGRIVGASKDAQGRTALRLALQTREQHIRRDKATSNICTSQVLLAIMASMYAVYHGPRGLRDIADRVHILTCALAIGLKRLGYTLGSETFFDTLEVKVTSEGPGQVSRDISGREIFDRAKSKKMNLRFIDGQTLGISLDETTSINEVRELLAVFALGRSLDFTMEQLLGSAKPVIQGSFLRTKPYLTHPVFQRYHSETSFLRYVTKLQAKDLSLAVSMIPLGSCTMKLNATSEMLPVTWKEFSNLHPFAPSEQAEGYREFLESLKTLLSEITGFPGISLQPNAGSQGEYAGLLVIKKYHESRGEGHRDVCLIPKSAHGTNPASAAMVGYRVVVVECDAEGNIDLTDLRAKAQAHASNLAALMVTYPSTHGVFEEEIVEVCDAIHKLGGQVYMDGANMNAQVGLCRPGDFGADVCHLNLHKTFCIPHGGGGPGMGPIGVKNHLKSFLPGHSVVKSGSPEAIGAVSAAPHGSASILPISWMYITMMGGPGLTQATKVALLNANYLAKKLDAHFPVLFRGRNGFVAHECIIDLRQLKATAGIEVQDVAKRLMDYGFHAPTVSFPVAGTMMIEPTESESMEELDRFCEALISIRNEIRKIETQEWPKDDNPLKNAPHTAHVLAQAEWTHPYSRELAVFPSAHTRDAKFWPAVGRINEVLGDRNLICSCPPIEDYQ